MELLYLSLDGDIIMIGFYISRWTPDWIIQKQRLLMDAIIKFSRDAREEKVLVKLYMNGEKGEWDTFYLILTGDIPLTFLTLHMI